MIETEDQKEVFDDMLDKLEEEQRELELEEQVLIHEQEELQQEEKYLEAEEEEIDILEKDEEELKEEENIYKQLLKHNDNAEARADLERMHEQIEAKRESILRHKLNISEILQSEGVDRVTKVSMTRSIASLHEWHENKKKRLAEKQRIAEEKRRVEEDEKVRMRFIPVSNTTKNRA